MSLLLIPIAPLSRTKSRLRDCFSTEQLKDLTLAMFKDLANKLTHVDIFNEKVVYCNSLEILDLANEYGLTTIKEELTRPRKNFDMVIQDLNEIAMKKFNAKKTLFIFLDTILISIKNFFELNELLEQNQLVVCPAINSAGISVLGRNPPDIIPTYFSEPNIPSLVALLNHANERNLKIAVYDSFRAGFDIDLKQDLALAYIYLKSFKLTDTETFCFLKNNLKITLIKKNEKNNRDFELKEIKY